MSSTSKPALTAGPALPNLARQFDLMCKGCRANGLHSWEDHFFMLYEEASKGTININEIAETIDYDYRNGNDGRAALDQLLAAIFADIRGLAEPRAELLTALKAAERAIDDCQNYRSHLHHKELAQVRAAIAKAEGGAA